MVFYECGTGIVLNDHGMDTGSGSANEEGRCRYTVKDEVAAVTHTWAPDDSPGRAEAIVLPAVMSYPESPVNKAPAALGDPWPSIRAATSDTGKFVSFDVDEKNTDSGFLPSYFPSGIPYFTPPTDSGDTLDSRKIFSSYKCFDNCQSQLQFSFLPQQHPAGFDVTWVPMVFTMSLELEYTRALNNFLSAEPVNGVNVSATVTSSPFVEVFQPGRVYFTGHLAQHTTAGKYYRALTTTCDAPPSADWEDVDIPVSQMRSEADFYNPYYTFVEISYTRPHGGPICRAAAGPFILWDSEQYYQSLDPSDEWYDADDDFYYLTTRETTLEIAYGQGANTLDGGGPIVEGGNYLNPSTFATATLSRKNAAGSVVDMGSVSINLHEQPLRSCNWYGTFSVYWGQGNGPVPANCTRIVCSKA